MTVVQLRKFEKELHRWQVADQRNIPRPAGPPSNEVLVQNGGSIVYEPMETSDQKDFDDLMSDVQQLGVIGVDTSGIAAAHGFTPASAGRPLPAVPSPAPEDPDHDYVDPDAGAYVNTEHLPPSHPIHTASTVNSNPLPETHKAYAHLPQDEYEVPVTVGDDM